MVQTKKNMSSHHIVREKQEPALLVLGLDDFSDELLGQLLEWSPTIISTRDTAEKLNSRGIKIDWVIGNSGDDTIQSDIKLLGAGDDTLTDAALKFLILNNYPAVNIITDDFKLKAYEFYVDKINMVIFHQHKMIYAVNSKFSKWKPGGETVELLTKVNNLHFDGLEKISHDKYITKHDGFFSLAFDGPFLFIAEEI